MATEHVFGWAYDEQPGADTTRVKVPSMASDAGPCMVALVRHFMECRVMKSLVIDWRDEPTDPIHGCPSVAALDGHKAVVKTWHAMYTLSREPMHICAAARLGMVVARHAAPLWEGAR